MATSVLNIPVEADEQGTSVGVGTIVRGALQAAIVNALASPLKLAGRCSRTARCRPSCQPPSVCGPGRAELSSEGAERLNQLAALLASRPAMAVRLQAAPTSADARWIREQKAARQARRTGGIQRPPARHRAARRHVTAS